MAVGTRTGEEEIVTLEPLRFITFEGGEGGGKSTQVRLLEARISALGHEVVVTREPGGSPRGERIREFILSGGGKPFGTFAEAILFSAARIDHIREIITPALQRGAFVICDRFADSTRAYQGVMGDIDMETIDVLERIAIGTCRPCVTFILDVEPATGLARANARRERSGGEVDRFESENLQFHSQLRQTFLGIARSDPARCHVVSSERPKEEVSEEIWQVVYQKLIDREEVFPARQEPLHG